MNEIIYDNGEIELKVSIQKETIWLAQKQIVEVFDSSKANISEHIKAIYAGKELVKNATVRKFRTVQKEGNREVTRELEHYSLDMIISVGYRVNSLKATKFRQWATSVLKSYITDGYAINSEKITNQRFVELENKVGLLKLKVENINSQIEDKSIKPSQGIFYDGQTFDAYIFVADLIKSAKISIKLIDNYIDETVLTLLSKNQNIQVTLYTKSIPKQLQLDIDKYNSQYNKIIIKKFNSSHDRFLIIDEKEVYHIGASLKDLGKKWFGFSKMDSESFEMMGRLK
ncbi:MAG: Putative DNA-binding protein in cluster with Type I restriction-modification system [uncultured Sulfurovum sp.]|uniref:DNA-binding protein in cluster with Type I restriction-modification system n=1 Tax=uncultured Sulfurovum sp. TaxID=269237 RepID=A0A6S6U191_9BACT|nr:MAG: Putative DNA-binding protein in cluster with Type I restriction-modification system [uncultured Sulfurovum sp.]